MINAIERARSICLAHAKAEINHFDGGKASPYVVLRQVDGWDYRSDNRPSVRYDVIQVDVWGRDAPDYAKAEAVRRALETAGFTHQRPWGDSEEIGGVIWHRISGDYQYAQDIEEG